MTITKNVSNYNDILLDIQTQSGTISQQVVLIKTIFDFGIYAILQIRAVSEFFRSLFFYVYLAVRQAYARYLTVVSVLCTRTKCFRKKTSNDCVKYFVRLCCKLTVAQ
jgi:hypothetical protein